ncbi:hypothetical protein LCGC14_0357990 [marine sediment metagenome]|uniref:Uncharacterized protein n=1 Tax=marine sediment metagenome TaxID=412755 RepID=A0A0F9WGZ8_9ZZZZ
MSEGKHTPTPWRVEGREIMAMKEREICHRRFAETKADLANYEFIAKACNAHAQDQKTIAALVAELQASTNRLNTVIDSGLLCDDMKRSLQKQNRFNEATLYKTANDKP